MGKNMWMPDQHIHKWAFPKVHSKSPLAPEWVNSQYQNTGQSLDKRIKVVVLEKFRPSP